MQLVVSPESGAHALAGVLHLGTGDVGVTLRRRHPGVAEDLLHDPDVDALLHEERSGGVAGVVETASLTPASRRSAFQIL